MYFLPGAYCLWLSTLLDGVTMDDDFLQNFCVCRAEFENDTLIWNDEYQAYETVQDAKLRERMIMEDLEDFNIPY
jgi:hypothetical protein